MVGGWVWLSQTRPIPRSPDGDKKIIIIMIKMITIITIIFRIQPGRRCLGSRAKAKQSPRRTERRQKLKKATSRLIMNLIRKMSLSLRAVISSEGNLLRKQKLLSFLVITTDILICCPFSTTSEQTNDAIQAHSPQNMLLKLYLLY